MSEQLFRERVYDPYEPYETRFREVRGLGVGTIGRIYEGSSNLVDALRSAVRAMDPRRMEQIPLSDPALMDGLVRQLESVLRTAVRWESGTVHRGADLREDTEVMISIHTSDPYVVSAVEYVLRNEFRWPRFRVVTWGGPRGEPYDFHSRLVDFEAAVRQVNKDTETLLRNQSSVVADRTRPPRTCWERLLGEDEF